MMLRASVGTVRRRVVSSSRVDVFASTVRSTNAQTAACITPNVKKEYTKKPTHRLAIHGIARGHGGSQQRGGSSVTSPYPMMMIRPTTVTNTSSSLAYRRKNFRWMSSSGKQDPPTTKNDDGVQPAAEGGEPGRLSSIVRSVGPTLRKVTEWNLGDLVSVYAVVLLVVLIVFSPYVIEQMKKAARSDYGDLDEYDPVAHTEKLIRYELFGKEDDEEETTERSTTEASSTESSRRSVDNTVDMAADVLKSNAVQEAIASLITRVLESVQFQNACQTLLKNLWNDLVNDPETTAQVVQLLNNAIQNKEIQRSVRRLVLQIINDKEVYDELTRLLVRLGQEDEVLDATRSLLTESAHNALNDPEILDHSMEFATDVVGDDIVQQTSGEALRNTVTYAVRPGVSVFLTILGVGLLFFSVSAFGRSRATEKEAELVDKAFASMARSIQSGAREGVSSLASLPGRLLSALLAAVTLPYRLAEKVVGGAGEGLVTAVSGAMSSIRAFPRAVFQTAVSLLQHCGRFLSNGLSASVSKLSSVVSGTFVGAAASSVSRASAAVVSAVSSAIRTMNQLVSSGAAALGSSLSNTSVAIAGTISACGTFVSGIIDGGGRVAGNLGTHFAVVGSQCSVFVKSSASVLASIGGSAKTVLSEVVKVCGTKLAGASAHLSSSFEATSKGISKGLLDAGTRISASIAAIASWCYKFFRRDDGSGTTTALS